MQNEKKLKWAVLGTGVIANEMAAGLQKMGKSIYAVGNRTYDKAAAFAARYGIEKVYESIDEMFFDADVDIIYITTPHMLFRTKEGQTMLALHRPNRHMEEHPVFISVEI